MHLLTCVHQYFKHFNFAIHIYKICVHMYYGITGIKTFYPTRIDWIEHNCYLKKLPPWYNSPIQIINNQPIERKVKSGLKRSQTRRCHFCLHFNNAKTGNGHTRGMRLSEKTENNKRLWTTITDIKQKPHL